MLVCCTNSFVVALVRDLWPIHPHPSTAVTMIPSPSNRELVRRREAGTLVQPPQPAQGQPLEAAADTLAVGASHPTWLVAAWLAQYGPQATLALLRWNNQ